MINVSFVTFVIFVFFLLVFLDFIYHKLFSSQICNMVLNWARGDLTCTVVLDLECWKWSLKAILFGQMQSRPCYTQLTCQKHSHPQTLIKHWQTYINCVTWENQLNCAFCSRRQTSLRHRRSSPGCQATPTSSTRWGKVLRVCLEDLICEYWYPLGMAKISLQERDQVTNIFQYISNIITNIFQYILTMTNIIQFISYITNIFWYTRYIFEGVG